MPDDETIHICKTCGGRLAGGQCPRCLFALASLCEDEPFEPRVFGDYELLGGNRARRDGRCLPCAADFFEP